MDAHSSHRKFCHTCSCQSEERFNHPKWPLWRLPVKHILHVCVCVNNLYVYITPSLWFGVDIKDINLINHTYLCLCVWQWTQQREQFMNAAEIRESQRDTYITLPHVERCEVNDVLCNNGSIFLPHLCCQNSQDLTASLSFHTLCIRSARHLPALALSNTKNIFIFGKCVFVCVRACVSSVLCLKSLFCVLGVMLNMEKHTQEVKEIRGSWQNM